MLESLHCLPISRNVSFNSLQEYTIDLTGQTSPTKRAELWKNRRVFFVTPQVLEKDIHSGLFFNLFKCVIQVNICILKFKPCNACGQ